jgi:phosphoesterase RecJ-like protein
MNSIKRREYADNLKQHAKSATSIAILTHKNPDGDGLAASLALKKFFSYYNIDSEVVLETECPNAYDYIAGIENTVVFEKGMNHELAILLDCHEQARVGVCSPIVEKASAIYAIDHHHERDIISHAHNWINTNAASVGEIIWNMFEDEIRNIACQETKAYIAEALYTTILNDTDNFVNANTNGKTFRMCAGLTEIGLNPGDIQKKFVWGKTVSEMQLIGKVLNNLEQPREDIIYIHSTLQMLDELGLDQDATSKMTKWLKGTKGIDVIVYYREVDTDVYRLSLRSNNVDVNRIARNYGGGGHTKAAGCEIKGSLLEIKSMIFENIKEQS